MSILVTGAAGFIGSHLVHHLLKAGAQVVAVDKLGYCSSLGNLPRSTAMSFHHSDLTDFAATKRLFKTHDISKIIHCAAESHVDNSFGSPFEFTRNNVVATQVLLDAAVEFGVEKFLHFSTDEVYGSCDHNANEETVLRPTNPYSASKASCDLLVQTYHKCYQLPTIITRCNNVYGPWQYPEKIIPKFITRILSGLPCVLHGSGRHMRAFLHVSDVAYAVESVLDSGQLGEIYNIGSQDELSNHEIAETLITKIGYGDIEYGPDRLFNDTRYNIDYSKLQQLGWNQRVSFEEGINDTIDWYKDNGITRWAQSSLYFATLLTAASNHEADI